MPTKPRIFVSVPDDAHLNDRRRRVKRAIIGSLADRGFDVAGFETESYGAGLPMHIEDWTVERASALIKRCDGALILALARTVFNVLPDQPELSDSRSVAVPLATAFNHLEGALVLAQQLPMLILLEQGIVPTGIFLSGVRSTVIPAAADDNWTDSDSFRLHCEGWASAVHQRRDVFLGYCSKANSTAKSIRTYLEQQGFTVLDWSRDFRPAGATILEEIERAASRCRCAVFLFTKDDELEQNAAATPSFSAVPRDNVLLEAGYFTRARGKERVAIIREKGAKMPSDFGGIIYLSLEDRRNLSGLKKRLSTFLSEAL
jgi:hypothetical protein